MWVSPPNRGVSHNQINKLNADHVDFSSPRCVDSHHFGGGCDAAEATSFGSTSPGRRRAGIGGGHRRCKSAAFGSSAPATLRPSSSLTPLTLAGERKSHQMMLLKTKMKIPNILKRMPPKKAKKKMKTEMKIPNMLKWMPPKVAKKKMKIWTKLA